MGVTRKDGTPIPLPNAKPTQQVEGTPLEQFVTGEKPPEQPTNLEALKASAQHLSIGFNVLRDPESFDRQVSRVTSTIFGNRTGYNANKDETVRPQIEAILGPAYAEPDAKIYMAKAKSPEEAIGFAKDFKANRDAEKVMSRASTGQSLLAGTAAIMLDPVTWVMAATAPEVAIPEATEVLGGRAALKAMGQAALAGATVESERETALQLMQPDRSMTESVMNIGAASLLSGFFEGAKIGYHNFEAPHRQVRISQELGKFVDAMQKNMEDGHAAVAGIQSEPPITQFVERAVEEKGTGKAVGAFLPGEWTPNMKALGDNSPQLKRALRALTESNQISTEAVEKGAVRGLAGAQDAESQMNALEFNSGWKKAVGTVQKGYADYLESGGYSKYLTPDSGSGYLSETEYWREVGKAMARGDQSDIPGITESAKAMREVSDWVLAKEQKAGVVHSADEVKQGFLQNKTAESWFPRRKDEAALGQDYFGFLSAVREDLRAKMMAERGVPPDKDVLEKEVADTVKNFTGMGEAGNPYIRKGYSSKTLKGRKWDIRDETIEPWLDRNPTTALWPTLKGRAARAVLAQFAGEDTVSLETIGKQIMHLDRIGETLDIKTGNYDETEAALKVAEDEISKMVDAKRGFKDELRQIKSRPLEPSAEGGPSFWADSYKLPSLLEDMDYADKSIEEQKRIQSLVNRFREAKATLVEMKSHHARRGIMLAPQMEQIDAHWQAKINEVEGKELPWAQYSSDAQAFAKSLKSKEAVGYLDKMEAEKDYLGKVRDSLLGQPPVGEMGLLKMSRPVREFVAGTSVGNAVVNQAAEVISPAFHVGLEDSDKALRAMFKDIKVTKGGVRFNDDFKLTWKQMEEMVGIMAHSSGQALDERAFGFTAAGATPSEHLSQLKSSIAYKAVEMSKTAAAMDKFVNFTKTMAGAMESNRILGLAEQSVEKGWDSLSAKDKAQLLTDGIDAHWLDRFYQSWKPTVQNFGPDRFRVPHTGDWADRDAAEVFQTHIIHRARTAANEITLGQTPYGVKLPFGAEFYGDSPDAKLLTIFQQYIFSTHENVYRRMIANISASAPDGVKEQAKTAAEMAAWATAMVAAGSFIGGVKRLQRGEDFMPKDLNEAVRDGLSNSNVFSLFTRMNDTAEITTGHSPLTFMGFERSKNLHDDPVQSLAAVGGPLVTKSVSAARAARALSQRVIDGKPLKRRDVRDMRSFIYAQNGLLTAPLFNLLENKIVEMEGTE